MSSKRKAPDSPSPQVNTIDECIDRYHFNWAVIPHEAPELVKHSAWVAANTTSGRSLVKAALRILNEEYVLSAQDALDILEEGIATYHLMCTKIDSSKPVPADLACFFAGVSTLVRHAGKAADPEWEYCPRPPFPKPLNSSPSAQALRDAPVLFINNPNFVEPTPPPKRHKPLPHPTAFIPAEDPPFSPPASPEAQPERSVHWEEDAEEGSSKKKGKSREADVPDSSPSGRQTRRTKGSSTREASGSKSAVGDKHPDVQLLLELQPLIDKKMIELAKSSGFGTATISLKDNSIIVTVTLTRKQPGTVPKARSHLGVVDDHRITKRGETSPIEEIEPLRVEEFRQLDINDAVQPLIGCGLCRLNEIICRPNGVGLACHNCARRRYGLLCDHAMGTLRFVATMYELASRASVIVPTLPISIPRLQDLTLLVRNTRSAHLLAQNEFVLQLQVLINTLRQQAHLFGDTGFTELYSGMDVGESPIEVFNDLIGTLNKAQRFDEEVDDGLTDKDADGSVPTTTKPSPSTSDNEEPEAPVVATPSKPPSKKHPSSSSKKPKSTSRV
ncbi:hypothetical protein C8R45DRAFT_921984 [Mycena sanguinolenta]|nr:hypothetical protein C8R45DRAFT_921984 [Mycena sanguinolenta]